mgnify:CR=1 FL=1
MQPRLVKIRSSFITLLLGYIGGIVFYLLGFPMPWLIGSMALLAAVAIHGRISINMPTPIRNSMLGLLGLMVGSTLNPEVMADAHKWWLTIAMLVPLLLVQLLAAFVFLNIFLKHEKRPTRFFGSAPGGLIEMVTMAREQRGDERSVLVMHMLRLSSLVVFAPLFFQVTAESAGGRQLEALTTGLLDYGAGNMLVLVLGLVLGAYVGRLLRLPAANILGPFVLASVIYGADILQAQPPYALMVLAQIGVGADLGARFAGYSLRRIRKLILPTLMVTGLFVLIAAGFAYGAHNLTSLPFATIFLAYMPGGMTQMSLIALALDLNAGFVMTHLLCRVFMVVLLAPICYNLFIRLFHKKE